MNTKKNTFEKGAKIFEWESPEYHSYQRGWLWYVIFCTVLFGSGIFFIFTDPEWGWIPGFVFFATAAVYFWKHLHPPKTHMITVYKNGIERDNRFLPFDLFEGFWFVSNGTVSILNLELKKGKDQKISLQMGMKSQEFFQESFRQINFPELEGKKESLTDLWIRALKL